MNPIRELIEWGLWTASAVVFGLFAYHGAGAKQMLAAILSGAALIVVLGLGLILLDIWLRRKGRKR